MYPIYFMTVSIIFGNNLQSLISLFAPFILSSRSNTTRPAHFFGLWSHDRYGHINPACVPHSHSVHRLRGVHYARFIIPITVDRSILIRIRNLLNPHQSISKSIRGAIITRHLTSIPNWTVGIDYTDYRRILKSGVMNASLSTRMADSTFITGEIGTDWETLPTPLSRQYDSMSSTDLMIGRS